MKTKDKVIDYLATMDERWLTDIEECLDNSVYLIWDIEEKLQKSFPSDWKDADILREHPLFFFKRQLVNISVDITDLKTIFHRTIATLPEE